MERSVVGVFVLSLTADDFGASPRSGSVMRRNHRGTLFDSILLVDTRDLSFLRRNFVLFRPNPGAPPPPNAVYRF